jgi:putative ABC transport system permease protein
MNTVWQDVRFGIRILAKTPGFTILAVLTLAFGIGMNTAVFSIVNAFLFRPLPVKDPSQLVVLATKDNHLEFPHYLSYLDYKDYRDKSAALSDAIAFAPAPVNFSLDTGNERIWAETVTSNYFSMLGIDATAGRTFLPEEDQGLGAHPVAVLSYSFWQNRFGGDPSAVGKVVKINGHPFTIVGIAPGGFPGTQPFLDINLYVPLSMLDQVKPGSAGRLNARDDHWLRVLGRLKEGVSLSKARADIGLLASQLEQEYPTTNKGVTLMVMPETKARPDVGVSDFLPIMATVFMGLVGLVLLITCANVANMLLARTASRQREIAIRMALGAGRTRIFRQLLIEVILLALLGGVFGFFLAYLGTSALAAIKLPADTLIHWFGLSPDLSVFAFNLLIAFVAATISGVGPAFQASNLNLTRWLNEGGRGGIEGSGRHRIRSILVFAQVAVSLVVLICAALFIRSLKNAEKIDLGFRTENLLLFSMDPGTQGYTGVRGQQFYQQLVDRVRALPGVRSAGLAQLYPFSIRGNQFIDTYVEGRSVSAESDMVSIFYNVAGVGYFESMGIPFVNGRDFTIQDNDSSSKVAIINETMAQQYWPNQSPLGKRISFEKRGGPFVEIVGVVRNAKYVTLGEDPRPFLYIPLLQNYRPLVTLHVQTGGEPGSSIAAVRQVVRDLDGEMPLFEVVAMDKHIRDGIALLPMRIGAVLASIFGVLALILTMVGIYGVISYSVSRRTNEIGIRVAMGARPLDILRLVVGQGMNLTAIGVVLGLVVALILGRLLASLLYGVSATDPVLFAASTLLLAAVATLACYIPARRAARLDPVVALREQ